MAATAVGAHESRVPIDTRVAILQALRAGTLSALEIVSHVREETASRVALSEARVYTELGRLEEEGLIAKRATVAGAGGVGRPRCIFALTDAGRALAVADRKAFAGLFGLGVAK